MTTPTVYPSRWGFHPCDYQTYRKLKLLHAVYQKAVRQAHAWRRWKLDWLTPEKPGSYTLLARAKDASGLAQPDRHDPNFGSYVINYPLPIEVIVEDRSS